VQSVPFRPLSNTFVIIAVSERCLPVIYLFWDKWLAKILAFLGKSINEKNLIPLCGSPQMLEMALHQLTARN
jgi:hypothetical protein